MKQARKADDDLARGIYHGPLHGIPYGIKDLFSVEGYKTTWGAAPYKDQQIAKDATVVKKLDEAGAVLLAKFSLGSLAMDDVWFGGLTRNPWDLNQGSWTCTICHRYRNLGIHSVAKQPLRSNRTQAYFWSREPNRRNGAELEYGQGGTDLPQRFRLCPGF